MKNEFLVTCMVICQWFARVTKSRPKNRYSWQRMYYFISYTLSYVLNTSFRYKQASIAHLAIVAKGGFSD